MHCHYKREGGVIWFHFASKIRGRGSWVHICWWNMRLLARRCPCGACTPWPASISADIICNQTEGAADLASGGVTTIIFNSNPATNPGGIC